MPAWLHRPWGRAGRANAPLLLRRVIHPLRWCAARGSSSTCHALARRRWWVRRSAARTPGSTPAGSARLNASGRDPAFGGVAPRTHRDGGHRRKRLWLHTHSVRRWKFSAGNARPTPTCFVASPAQHSHPLDFPRKSVELDCYFCLRKTIFREIATLHYVWIL